MIRLLLADDQALVRGALSALLGLEPDLEVVAEVVIDASVVAPAAVVSAPSVSADPVSGTSAASVAASVPVASASVVLVPASPASYLSGDPGPP